MGHVCQGHFPRVGVDIEVGWTYRVLVSCPQFHSLVNGIDEHGIWKDTATFLQVYLNVNVVCFNFLLKNFEEEFLGIGKSFMLFVIETTWQNIDEFPDFFLGQMGLSHVLIKTVEFCDFVQNCLEVPGADLTLIEPEC